MDAAKSFKELIAKRIFGKQITFKNSKASDSSDVKVVKPRVAKKAPKVTRKKK